MQRSILNVYLKQVPSGFSLRFVEIHPWEDEDAPTQIRYLPVIIGNMLSSIGTYNGVSSWESPEAKKILWYCHSYVPFQHENLVNYSYTDFTWILPGGDDEKIILMQLGALDGGIHQFRGPANAPYRELKIFYHETEPDRSNKSAILSQSQILGRSEYSEPNLSLSRYVATWIVNKINSDPKSKNYYASLLSTLEKLLASEDHSLTRAIREVLYPDVTIDKFLEQHCHGDVLLTELLNPKVHFKDKTNNLIKSLRVRSLISSGIEFIKSLKFSEAPWASMTPSLFGKPAPDKGTYHHSYTEVTLLNQATLQFNTEGEFALKFLDTEAYTKYYAVGCKNYDILELELRTACELLGISLLPNQNFHGDMIKFTADANLKLWFMYYNHLKKAFWKCMVETIYGKPAEDGGYYTKNYTEVELLFQSNLHFSNEGRFILQFLDTGSYTKHYAKGQRLYDILEIELRAVCKLLGLDLLPDQDFHKGEVYFTPASDLILKNYGFHINEEHCKALMRASKYKHLFFKAGDSENTLRVLDDDLQITVIEQIEPLLSRVEIQSIWNKPY